jgi:hypothetical protein
MNYIQPSEAKLDPELAPAGTPLHVAVAPGLLEQEHTLIREPDESDADYESRRQMFAAVLDYARRS